MAHSTFTQNNTLLNTLLQDWQNTIANIKHSYIQTSHRLTDEFLIKIDEQQLNDLLQQKIVRNVKLLLDLNVQLFDGYLRLYCTANLLGLYLSVYADFRLTQIRIDKTTQQVVFEQLSDTHIVSLHAKQWYKSVAIRHAIGAYRLILKKDPLPFLLSLSPKLSGKPFIKYKGQFIYLEFGRWLPETLKGHLRKVNVSYAEVHTEQLIVRVQPNYGEILSFGDPNAAIITEKDNPKNSKHT